jgi:hypothetical protein
MAGGLFNKLKTLHYNVEYVQEFAKRLTWEKNFRALEHQFYVSANQVYAQDMLCEQVEAVITDSPIILGLMYYKEPNLRIKKAFENFLVETFRFQNNINFFINRKKKYNPKGRNQNEKEAREIDVNIRSFLDKHQIPYHIVDGNDAGLKIVKNEVIKFLGEK